MIRELDCIALTADLPDAGLERGSLGAVVFAHEDGLHFEVEFVSPSGETLSLSTLRIDQIRRVAVDGGVPESSESRGASLGYAPNP